MAFAEMSTRPASLYFDFNLNFVRQLYLKTFSSLLALVSTLQHRYSVLPFDILVQWKSFLSWNLNVICKLRIVYTYHRYYRAAATRLTNQNQQQGNKMLFNNQSIYLWTHVAFNTCPNGLSPCGCGICVI